MKVFEISQAWVGDFHPFWIRQLNSVRFAGLKTVVAEINPGSALATMACTTLAPKVVAQLDSVRLSSLFLCNQLELTDNERQASSSPELIIDSLDLLYDILTRFESTIRPLTHLQQSILKSS